MDLLRIAASEVAEINHLRNIYHVHLGQSLCCLRRPCKCKSRGVHFLLARANPQAVVRE